MAGGVRPTFLMWQANRALASRARRFSNARRYVSAMRALGASCKRWRMERRAAMVWLDLQRQRAMRSWEAACSVKVMKWPLVLGPGRQRAGATFVSGWGDVV